MLTAISLQNSINARDENLNFHLTEEYEESLKLIISPRPFGSTDRKFEFEKCVGT